MMWKSGTLLVLALTCLVLSGCNEDADLEKTSSRIRELMNENKKLKEELEAQKKAFDEYRSKYQVKVWKDFEGVKSAKFYSVGENGKQFTNAVIREIDPGGVRISHDKGVASIPFEELPEKVRTMLHYDPELAAQFRESQAEAIAEQQVAYQQKMKKAEKKQSKDYETHENNLREQKIARLKKGIDTARTQMRLIQREIYEKEAKQRNAEYAGRSASHTAGVSDMRKKMASLELQITRANSQLQELYTERYDR